MVNKYFQEVWPNPQFRKLLPRYAYFVSITTAGIPLIQPPAVANGGQAVCLWTFDFNGLCSTFGTILKMKGKIL